MTKKEATAMRAQIEELGWSQGTAAKELGVTLRTMQRYCSGDAAVPPAMFLALRWLKLIQGNERVIELIDKRGMRLKYELADGGQADVTEGEKQRLQGINAKLKTEVKKVSRKR